jgi:hypothetical protein
MDACSCDGLETHDIWRLLRGPDQGCIDRRQASFQSSAGRVNWRDAWPESIREGLLWSLPTLRLIRELGPLALSSKMLRSYM